MKAAVIRWIRGLDAMRIEQLTRQGIKYQGNQKSILNNYKDIYTKHFRENLKIILLKPYPKDPRGGLVRTRSKEDVVFLNTDSHVLFQGVFQNAQSCSIEGGVRKCAGYLWHKLWWFRTVQGLAVEKVYGFTVCGPRCKGTNRTVLSLLILSSVSKIGGSFRLEEYRGVELNDLRAFLKHKDFGNPFCAPYILSNRVCPGSMIMPNSLLLRPPAAGGETPVWKIITTGTANLVLRLDLTNKKKAKDFIEQLTYVGFLDNFLFKRTVKSGENFIYLKIKSAACGYEWSKRDLLTAIYQVRSLVKLRAVKPNLTQNQSTFYTKAEWGHFEEWDASFPEICSYDIGSSIMFLTCDMGERLEYMGPQRPSFQKFCIEYMALIERTLFVETHTKLVHGDIHEGNLVCDKYGKLHLIDWDEATLYKPIPRNAVTRCQRERYPKKFEGGKGLLFTKVQLFVLFRDMLESIYKKRLIVATAGGGGNGKQLGCKDLQKVDPENKITLLDVGKAEAKEWFKALVTFLLGFTSS